MKSLALVDAFTRVHDHWRPRIVARVTTVALKDGPGPAAVPGNYSGSLIYRS